MATGDQTREEAFETEIAEYLADHGWDYSASDDGYDAVRALWPEDVHWWLSTTQAEEYGKVVKVGTPSEQADREALLDTLVARLDTPIGSGGGTLNVLRRKFSHTRGATAHFRICQFAPATTLNPAVAKAYESVRLRVVRQVHFSSARGDNRSIDLVFFVNGLPVATLELKSFFKQEWRTAVKQYKQDRDPKGQPLLSFGARALVHFAVDDDEVWMTTRLAGEKTYFLPFNRGHDDGAKGNPANPAGAATSYLWEEVLQRRNWLDILGALMFLREETDEDPVTGKIKRKKALMFPRYHQWRAVRKIVTAIRTDGTGRRYLIEHSAGSGKTNTIAWTAHRLARLHDGDNRKVFDKVLIVSDRKVLDRQLQDAVEQVDNTAGSVAVIDSAAVRRSGGSKSRALLDALTGSALIVVVTIQTFPHVKGLLETTLGDRSFAVLIDEAHTSQSGKTAADLKKILTESGEQMTEDEAIDTQDVVNDLLSADDERELRIAAETAARAGARNVSFLAFTATPKDKTKRLFGRDSDEGKPASFDVYTMRQAIEEGFILDVLRGYQTYKTAFEIEQRGHDGVVTTITSDDERLVDPKVATRAIMRFKNLHASNIGQKVEVIVEHFRANVAHLLDGQAKAMVVTDSRQAAVRYKVETDSYIRAKGYKIKTIVAYSGDITDAQYGLEKATEATMNPGLGADLAREFKRPDYRLMLVAEKFQTGFDQPLLCAMYVDKKLPDVHAVQTLSRLNRIYRAPSGEVKDKTFVLDFVNDPVDIQKAFLQYYTEAHVETATDPNLVHQLATKLDQARIYTRGDVERYAEAWWGAQRHAALAAAITPARDEFANRWAVATEQEGTEALNELRTFRKDCGSYVRLYDFMSQVVDYATTDLEKLAEFLRQLVRLLAVDDLRADVDMSGIVLKRIRQIDQGKADIALSGSLETPALKGITGVGSGVTHDDPQQVLLSEVIAKVNTLFGGEFADPQIGGFVIAAAGMAEEDPRIAEQIDNNAVDQFLVSPDLRETLTDAAVLNEGAFGKLTGALTGGNERADEFIRLIGAYLYQTRRARLEIADTETEAYFGVIAGRDAYHAGKDMTIKRRDEAPGPGTSEEDRKGRQASASSWDADAGRYLKGQCPDSVRIGDPFSVLASIVRDETGGAPLKPFPVGPEGKDILLVLHAPGLQVLSGQRRVVHVPPGTDSEPEMFELKAVTPGPSRMSITAWLGGTYLGELTIETIADRDQVSGDRHRDFLAAIDTVAAEGAVSLVVRYDPVQNAYRFEFRDDDNPDEVPSQLAYEPGPRVERLVAELDRLTKDRANFTASETRDYLREAGIGLWNELLPEQLRQQFWDRQHKITQLTILADRDTVPWELLYPFDPGSDAGFLVEQFPVTRMVFRHRPARSLSMSPPWFVLPDGSPTQARDEVTELLRLLQPQPQLGAEPVIGGLTPLLELIRAGDFGLLHFACHNSFDPSNGSAISLDKRQFTPTQMNSAAIGKVLARSTPTVFINACRSAGAKSSYLYLDGWANKFIEAGAGAFIGTLWAVRDSTAREFARELYLHLQEGEPLGKAVMQARLAAASEPGDPTWLAYAAYGDPRATLR
jgi:type I restriction enzyme, R subunit